jgi:hypothetical protein
LVWDVLSPKASRPSGGGQEPSERYIDALEKFSRSQHTSKEAEMHNSIEAPILAGEMAIAWSQRVPIIQQRALCKAGGEQEPKAPPPVLIDQAGLLIWTADVLQRPLGSVELLDQVGRFVTVAYEPIQRPDPDILLALIPGSQAFHRGVLDFQRARQQASDTEALWYYQAKEAARRVLTPLRLLRPHPLEADFAIRWLLLGCARGRMRH